MLFLPVFSKQGLQSAADEAQQKNAPVDPQLEAHYKALNKAKALGYDDAAQVIQQRIQQTTSKLQDQMATRGMSGPDLFKAGMGAGMTRVARGAKDLGTAALGTVLKKVTPGDAGADLYNGDGSSPADDERKRAEDQLKMTGAGDVGDLAGETAALAPATMGVGGVLEKAGADLASAGLRTAGKMLSSSTVRSAAEGATAGALSADPGDRGEGAAMGAAGATALTLGGKLLRRGYQGVVKPSPSADYLRRQGVDLTLGQMNPGGKLAQLEEASQSVSGAGRTIENQRQAGRESWQDVMLRKSQPPGSTTPARSPGNMSERINQTYKGFEPAYDAAVKGESVYPATHGSNPTPFQTTSSGRKLGSFDLSVLDPNALATEEQQKTVKRFLDNQLSLLPGGTTRPPVLKQVPAEVLQKMRSNIRAAVRQMSSSNEPVKAQLLVNAEKQVSEALDTQLKNPDLLRQTDRQYAKYKVVEGAQAAANGLPADFTPAQALRQVKKGMSDGLFARGGGGEMRRMSVAGRDVLDTRVPATGARMLTHAAPAALGWMVGGPAGAAGGAAAGPSLTAAALAAGNKAPLKNMLTGNTGPQRAAQMLELALKRNLGQGGRQHALDAALISSALLGNKGAQAANGD